MSTRKNVAMLWVIGLLGILVLSGCTLMTIQVRQSGLDVQMTADCEQTRTAVASAQAAVAETAVVQATTQAMLAPAQATLAAAQTAVAKTAVAQATTQAMLATMQATLTATQPAGCQVLYDFETDDETWQLNDEPGNEGGLSVFRSAERAFQGQGALQLDVRFPGDQWKRATIMKQFSNADWSAYTEISFDVYMPPEAKGFQIEVYSKTENWITTQWPGPTEPRVYLSTEEWIPITVPLKQLGNVQALHEIGIMIGTGQTPFEGAFYIDHICVR